MVDHPLSVDPLNATTACPLLAVAATFVGAFATVAGTTAFEALLDVPVPAPLYAATVNV